MSKLFSVSAFATAASVFAAAASAQVNLSSETAGAGGVPHTVLSHLAEIAAERGIASIQVAAGQTLTNSVQNVAEGKTDIASAPLLLPFLLSKGRGPYAALGEEKGAELAKNLRALYPYSFGSTALYAFDSVGIKGWEDLKGRRVYNGPPRGAALTMARQITQLVTGYKEGDDYTGVQVNWGQDVKTMTDGSADAMVLPMGFPDRRMTVALASGAMTIWSIPKDLFEGETFQKYLASPGVGPTRIAMKPENFPPTTTVHSEDDLFRAVSTTGTEVVQASMDFELAKALTKAHIETLEALKGKAAWAPNINLGIVDADTSDFCGLNPLKYHPGAVAAWEEAGYTIPDCAKP